ncbi:MAG: hypothetical protein RLY86_3985 [Pseudomonadota bacterium]|jgi:hypothetical protein
MARRSRHPHPAIEAALRHAEGLGWRCTMARGHAFAQLWCPWNDAECRCGEFCRISVWSTPRDPEIHARQIRRQVDGCIALMRERQE